MADMAETNDAAADNSQSPSNTENTIAGTGLPHMAEDVVGLEGGKDKNDDMKVCPTTHKLWCFFILMIPDLTSFVYRFTRPPRELSSFPWLSKRLISCRLAVPNHIHDHLRC